MLLKSFPVSNSRKYNRFLRLQGKWKSLLHLIPPSSPCSVLSIICVLIEFQDIVPKTLQLEFKGSDNLTKGWEGFTTITSGLFQPQAFTMPTPCTLGSWLPSSCCFSLVLNRCLLSVLPPPFSSAPSTADSSEFSSCLVCAFPPPLKDAGRISLLLRAKHSVAQKDITEIFKEKEKRVCPKYLPYERTPYKAKNKESHDWFYQH